MREFAVWKKEPLLGLWHKVVPCPVSGCNSCMQSFSDCSRRIGRFRCTRYLARTFDGGKGLRGKYARRSRGRFATQRLCRLTLPPVGKYGLSWIAADTTVTVCFNHAWFFSLFLTACTILLNGVRNRKIVFDGCWKEKSKVFCMFRKKSYLCIKWVAHQRNWCKYVETRTVANSLPRFLMIRINFLFLADYVILPKICNIFGSKIR